MDAEPADPGERRRVLLIGGASGAGKTTLASMLAVRLGCSWLQADSTWLAMTTFASHPILRFFPELQGSGITFEKFDARFREASTLVGNALERTIEHELEGRPEGFVLEGTWMSPEWMSGVAVRLRSLADIRGLVVFESEPAELLNALRSRTERQGLTPSQLAFGDWAWRIGQRLREESEALGIPVVAARPRASLLDRALAAFEDPGKR